MNHVWFKDCKTDKDKQDLKDNLLNNKYLLDKLSEICYNMLKESDSVVKPDDYDCPSWSHKQAHKNGHTEAVQKILKILDITR